jgi:TonB family protein
MNPTFVLTTIVMLVSTYASAQYEAQLSSALVKHQVVLRNYYTDAHLEYDSDGKLVSKGTPGFGPTDGTIYVERLQLQPDKLVLTGNRPVPILDTTTGAYRFLDIGNSVAVKVSLPANQPASQSVPHLLNQIFMKQSELDKMKCSSEEEEDFRKNVLNPLTHKQGFDKSQVPPATTLDQLRAYCFPNGERAYLARGGIKAPKVISAPDPRYPEGAKNAAKEGTVLLLLIVDTNGQPTTMSIVRALGSGFDANAVAAVAAWRFQPGKFNDKPVLVPINVEVNFKLH